MIVYGLEKVQVKFVFAKKLQGPISSTGRNDRQSFCIGDSYALRTLHSQHCFFEAMDPIYKEPFRIEGGFAPEQLFTRKNDLKVYVSYINISTVRLNSCLFISRPINEAKSEMVSDYLSSVTA